MEKSPFQFQYSYHELDEMFYTEQVPEKVSKPQLIVFNQGLAEELDIQVNQMDQQSLAEIFSGNTILDDTKPIAQAYAGHQFGSFTMLGDGRAILLGEHVTEDGKVVDIQLKGAGRTPYSRAGDGRAALGPMLREFIISEAMYALNIPTSRSLAVVVTGDPVYRERPLPGAILTRVASSHLRVGTFQYAQAFGEENAIKELADYAIRRHYPEIKEASNQYRKFLEAVIQNQAKTIAKWQLVGFIHGVMNTDNMTISGESIDYGPCAFMDTYDPNTVFSSIDKQGRYAYRNQPPIGMWNVTRFAETLLPLLHEEEEEAIKVAKETLATFGDVYRKEWLNGMRNKLGLEKSADRDLELIEQLLKLMDEQKMDYTNTFVNLTFGTLDKKEYETEAFQTWFKQYETRLSEEGTIAEEREEMMKQYNPAVIPRNFYVEEALNAVVDEGDFSKFHSLMQALKNPFAHTEQQRAFQILPPEADGPFQTYCGT
ncbi:protein adenylyltransferase SelO [Pseudogracilibacillus sp. ICA-222130]|uniref:protein adenylyltransferase SelO n=1 Tax=Pseudogracilibacillus sp. ICA-222130 TaxID=3134655 RepID=UPI0030C643A9